MIHKEDSTICVDNDLEYTNAKTITTPPNTSTESVSVKIRRFRSSSNKMSTTVRIVPHPSDYRNENNRTD